MRCHSLKTHQKTEYNTGDISADTVMHVNIKTYVQVHPPDVLCSAGNMKMFWKQYMQILVIIMELINNEDAL